MISWVGQSIGKGVEAGRARECGVGVESKDDETMRTMR